MGEWHIEQGGESLGPIPLAEVYDRIDRGEASENAWFNLDGVRVDLTTLRQHWPDPRSASDEPASEPPLDELTEIQPPGRVERDTILILGRRRAGKTVYLATLYNALWKSLGGLTMKALAGPTHKMLTGVADQLQRGHWPEATLGTRQLEFELDDHGHKRVVVAFDYSGEDFRRAFVDEETESPEVKKLLSYLHRAAAVILLIDPAVAAGGKHDEVVDDDFGMVQAVQRVRKIHGGEDVPVVLALTKADRNREVIQSAGTKREFILRHYPALVRTLGKLTVYTISAVQEVRGSDGSTCPSPDSVPINIDKPLLRCLERMRRRDERKRKEAAHKAARQAQLEHVRQEERAQTTYHRKVAYLVAGIIIIALCVYALIWILRTG
ncbi:MAG: GTPase domain-containing protein [Planctomycetes bacterium]|nr:GTPase domain-containing protein [Planctomycetota bacterium]